MYDEGYDTDGYIGPFYDSVEHKEVLAPNIEEEALPPKEALEALMIWAENPINNGMKCQVKNDVTAENAGTFAFISDKDVKKMRVKELQDELQKWGCIKRGRTSESIAHLKKVMLDRTLIVDDNAAPTNTETSSSELPGFPDEAYWEELLPQSAP
eukprot:2346797-Ditylum_brightwellii.AAC.1